MRSRARSLFSFFVIAGTAGVLFAESRPNQARTQAASSDLESRDRLEVQGSHDSDQHRGNKLRIFGLTSTNQLVRFDSNAARKARTVGDVSGLAGDTVLIGIDFRPASGDLYGVGDAGGVYTIDVTSGAATFHSQLNVALSGTSFGVDFNPTVDRLRIVSDMGQNLRVNVDTGATTVDTPLTAMGISGAAYSNNDTDSNTATTLFDVDALLDQVAIQAPPNNGNINPTGKLLLDAGAAVGFDIYTNVSAGSNAAYASLQSAGVSAFYSIDVLTGRATLLGTFASQYQVVDIAIPLN